MTCVNPKPKTTQNGKDGRMDVRMELWSIILSFSLILFSIKSIAQEESEIWLIQMLLNHGLIKGEGPQ